MDKRIYRAEAQRATSHKLIYEPQHAPSQTPWKPMVDESRGRLAQKTALIIAERMRDPGFVHTTAEQVNQQSRYPFSWSSLSLSSGDVGIAFMYDYLDRCFPGQGWNMSRQRYLDIAVSGSQRSTFWSPSLYTGTSGMAFVILLASREGKYYQKTMRYLHQGLCMQILHQTWQRSGADGEVSTRDYDLIAGAAGVLTYLVSIEHPNEITRTAIEHILHYLLWLAEPGQVVGKERWYIPPAHLSTNRQREVAPQGLFDCGLAHGIPGPLAALALTWLAGYRYGGLRESIAYLANWLVEHRANSPWGIDWPSFIPLERAARAQDWNSLSPARTAWCYGAPGISRSLWLAGQAVGDERLQHTAVEAIESALQRPVAERNIPSLHLCHGIAGLLMVCLRFAHEGKSMLVQEKIPVLVEQILDTFDPTSALGLCERDGDQPLDQPSWLTGAPGLAMTLLAASTPVMPLWDRVLAIA